MIRLWCRTVTRTLAIAELIVLIAAVSLSVALPALFVPRLEKFAVLLALLLFTAASLALGITLFLMALMYLRDQTLALWERHTPPFEDSGPGMPLEWGGDRYNRAARRTMYTRVKRALVYLLGAYVGVLLFVESGGTFDDIPEIVFTLLTAAQFFGEEIPIIGAIVHGSDRIPPLSQEGQLALVLIFCYPIVALSLAIRNYIYLRSQVIFARAVRFRMRTSTRRDVVIVRHPVTVGLAAAVLVGLSETLPVVVG